MPVPGFLPLRGQEGFPSHKGFPAAHPMGKRCCVSIELKLKRLPRTRQPLVSNQAMAFFARSQRAVKAAGS